MRSYEDTKWHEAHRQEFTKAAPKLSKYVIK